MNKWFKIIPICLLTVGILAVKQTNALDSASDTRKRTSDSAKQAAIDEVPRLMAEVEREINNSAASGIYFAVVRVNGYSENAVKLVVTNLKIKGYEVSVGRSGKHREFRNIVINWYK